MLEQDTSWMKEAMCQGASSHLFFPEPKHTKVIPAQYKIALAICGACPVQKQCLDYALKHRMIEDGIYGGKLPHQRRQLLNRRPKRKIRMSDTEVSS